MANCPNCGTSVPEPIAANQYCPSCGAALTTPSASSPRPYFAPAPAGWTPGGSVPINAPRPTGITILAVLSVLDGIGWLLLGVLFAFVGTAGSIPILDGIGAFAVLVGFVFFGAAYGLWTGRPWSWTISFVVTAISLVFSIGATVTGLGVAYVILGLIFDVLILYYLTRPHVRAFFGKGPFRLTKPL